MARFLFISLLCGLASTALFAQTSGGGYAESYLLRDFGARAIAMDGAYTAIANDASAIFYNPAGLAMMSQSPQAQSTITPMSLGRTHSTLSYGQAINDDYGIGASINSFSNQSFTARNAKGDKIGDYQNWQMSASIGGAVKVESASVGASLKYLSNSLVGSGAGASGYGLDVGMKMNVLNLFSLGVSVQNITGMMFWNTKDKTQEILPYTIRVGSAFEFALNQGEAQVTSNEEGGVDSIYKAPTRFALVSVETAFTEFERTPNFILGFEVMPHEIIGFRGGFNFYGAKDNKPQLFPFSKWGAGIALKPKLDDLFEAPPFKLEIDYSVSNDYISSGQVAHSLSFVFQF